MDKRRDEEIEELTKLLSVLLSVSYVPWDYEETVRDEHQAEMIVGLAIKEAATHADQVAAHTAVIAG